LGVGCNDCCSWRNICDEFRKAVVILQLSEAKLLYNEIWCGGFSWFKLRQGYD
jgi:hypothetical protein